MKRYLDRDFLVKNKQWNTIEVSNYMNKAQHIYEEATCKGIWVDVREDKKYCYNYVTRLLEPTIEQILTQLTRSGVDKLGNIKIHNISDEIVNALSRRYNGVKIKGGFHILFPIPERSEFFLELCSESSIGKALKYDGSITTLKNFCKAHDIKIKMVKNALGHAALHESGSWGVEFNEQFV